MKRILWPAGIGMALLLCLCQLGGAHASWIGVETAPGQYLGDLGDNTLHYDPSAGSSSDLQTLTPEQASSQYGLSIRTDGPLDAGTIFKNDWSANTISVTLTNNGTYPLASIAFFSDTVDLWHANAREVNGATLDPGESKTYLFNVKANSSSTQGANTALLQLRAAVYTHPLSYIVVPQAASIRYDYRSYDDALNESWLSADATLLDFGTVSEFTGQQKTVTLTNHGPLALRLNIESDSSGQDFDPLWQGRNNPGYLCTVSDDFFRYQTDTELDPGESTTFTVTLPKPIGANTDDNWRKADLASTITVTPTISSQAMSESVTLEVKVSVRRDTYNLRVDYGNGLGRVYIDGNPQGMYDRDYVFAAGRDILIEAKPYDSAKYHVSDLIVNGESLGPVTSYTLKNAQNDFHVNVSFAEGPAPAAQPSPAPQPQAPAGGSSQPAAWAKPLVDQAAALGIVPASLQSGYDRPATRAQFCALADGLYTAAKGAPAPLDASITFRDTSDPAVLRMASAGVVNGTGEGQFSPNQALTREQAAAMLARLARALGIELPAGTSTFADSGSISPWAAPSVGMMQSSGIMSGTGGNLFSPQQSYSVEQSIVTCMRLYSQIS